MTRYANRANATIAGLLNAYAILVPLFVVPRGGGKSIGASDVLALIALAWCVRFPARDFLGIRAFFGVFFVGALVGSSALILGGTNTISSLVLLVRTVAIFAPLFLVARLSGPSVAVAEKALRLFLWSGTLACTIGIGLDAVGIQVRDAQQMAFYGNGYGSSLRAGGLTGNSSDFGHLAAILATAALAYVVLFRQKRLLAASALVASLVALYLSDSRAGFVHVGIALLCMAPIYFRGSRISIALIGIPLVATALAALSSMVTFGYREMYVVRRLDFLNLTGDSLFYSTGSRTGYLARSWTDFTSHPLLGIGYGATGGGDNSFLTILAETGVVAGFAYVVFWLLLVVRSGQISDRTVRTVAIALAVSEIAQMFTVDTQRMWSSTPIELLIVGLLARGFNSREIGSPKSTVRFGHDQLSGRLSV